MAEYEYNPEPQPEPKLVPAFLRTLEDMAERRWATILRTDGWR